MDSQPCNYVFTVLQQYSELAITGKNVNNLLLHTAGPFEEYGRDGRI